MTVNEQVVLAQQSGLMELALRNPRERFSVGEKLVLGGCMEDLYRAYRPEAEVFPKMIPLEDGYFKWGEYPDGEQRAMSTESGRLLRVQAGDFHTFVTANIETAAGLLTVRALLAEMGARSVSLATAYFPNQRGERPEFKVGTDLQEIVVLDTAIADLAREGVEQVLVVDSHSPAFSLKLLEQGIVVWDISALPMMVGAARRLGWLEGNRVIAASGDDGAREMGLLVRELVGCDEVINGNKELNLQGKKQVNFSKEDLEKVNGAVVVLGEDIISTGGTMKDVITLLLEAGAERVVILATYPIFAGQALENLGFDGRVKIVVTDGRTPKADLSASPNIVKVFMLDRLAEVMKYQHLGGDITSDEGEKFLASLGFCRAAWLNQRYLAELAA